MNERILSSGCAVLVCLALGGCFDAHGGGKQTSTETGNPPAIDVDLVALVVSQDQVHVTGSAGAVTPGGSPVSARNLISDKTVRGHAEANGAFDLRVDGSQDDVFELRAGAGAAVSEAVFVSRGGASVSANDGGTLSCERQEQMGARRLDTAVADADVSCTANSDCVRASTNAVCHDACEEVIVSKAGKAQIDEAVNLVNSTYCGTYAFDGCMLIAPPCVPPQPGSPTCVAGKCELGPERPQGSCDERASVSTALVDQAISQSDLGCTTADDCTLVASLDHCKKGCDTNPVSVAGLQQVATATDLALTNSCTEYFNDGCTNTSPVCVAALAACHDGSCEVAATDDGGMLTCEEGTTQAQLLRAAAIAQADRECTTTSDCVAAGTSTRCETNCTVPVSQMGATQLKAAITDIDRIWCGNFAAGGACQQSIWMCGAPPGPIACIDGTCGYDTNG